VGLALITKGKLWPKPVIIREEIDTIDINVSEVGIDIEVSAEPSFCVNVTETEYNIDVSTSEDSVTIEVEEVGDINFEVGC
jgi:hypothetical protein